MAVDGKTRQEIPLIMLPLLGQTCGPVWFAAATVTIMHVSDPLNNRQRVLFCQSHNTFFSLQIQPNDILTQALFTSHARCFRYGKLLFDIFDVDRRGNITMAELDAMLRMLYGSQDADPELLKLLAINGSGDDDALTFDEFLQVCWWYALGGTEAAFTPLPACFTTRIMLQSLKRC